jgi:transcriptional antiterminator RfaH
MVETVEGRKVVARTGPRWFVVITHANQERIARAHLIRQGIEVYLPMRMAHPKSRVPVVPFLPRYLFVRLDLDVQSWLNVLSTVGVVDMIRRPDGPPIPLLDDAVQRVRRREVQGVLPRVNRAAAAAYAEAASPVKVGDKVRVAKGAMNGKLSVLEMMDGMVDAVLDIDRVAILFKVMGRQTRFEMQVGDLDLGAGLR